MDFIFVSSTLRRILAKMYSTNLLYIFFLFSFLLLFRYKFRLHFFSTSNHLSSSRKFSFNSFVFQKLKFEFQWVPKANFSWPWQSWSRTWFECPTVSTKFETWFCRKTSSSFKARFVEANNITTNLIKQCITALL